MSEKCTEIVMEIMMPAAEKLLNEKQNACIEAIVSTHNEISTRSSASSTSPDIDMNAPDGNGYRCLKCNRSLATPFSLTRHIDTFHGASKHAIEPDTEVKTTRPKRTNRKRTHH